MDVLEAMAVVGSPHLSHAAQSLPWGRLGGDNDGDGLPTSSHEGPALCRSSKAIHRGPYLLALLLVL